jgi:hypothetical protein
LRYKEFFFALTVVAGHYRNSNWQCVKGKVLNCSMAIVFFLVPVNGRKGSGCAEKEQGLFSWK